MSLITPRRENERSVAIFRRAMRLLIACGRLHADSRHREAAPLAEILFERAAHFALHFAAGDGRPVEPPEDALPSAREMLVLLDTFVEETPELTLEAEVIRHGIEEFFRLVVPGVRLRAARRAAAA